MDRQMIDAGDLKSEPPFQLRQGKPRAVLRRVGAFLFHIRKCCPWEKMNSAHHSSN